MTRGLWALAAVALLALGVSAWEGHRASTWQRQADAALAVAKVARARNDSLARQAAADSGRAARAVAVAAHAGARADSLDARLRAALAHRPAGPAPADTAPAAQRATYWQARAEGDEAALVVALQEIDTLHVERDSLRAAYAAQARAAAQFHAAYLGEQQRADSLGAVLARAPKACHKIPLIGLPMPRLGIGPAVGPSAPYFYPIAAALIIPLGGC